ncbi:MAG: hypothetical protein JOZ33_09245 [Acidobacteriaceae bacterium]|nr:hypothetical protein [Acidobacteriaceae bacterium]
MRNILRTLALTGIVAAAAVAGQAQAQAQVGIAVRVGPPVYYSGYVPPCPGPDFYWTSGYYAGTVWVPGRWVHRDRYYVRDWDEHRDYDRHYRDYDRHDYYHRGWDHERR